MRAPDAGSPWSSDAVPRIRIDARVGEAEDAIDGTMRYDAVNRTGRPLTEACFHLFANAARFRAASTEVTGAEVDGRPVAPRVEDAGTLLVLPLAQDLAVGARTSIVLRFRHHPSTTGGYEGLANRDGTSWCLYHWYPEPVPRTDGGERRHGPLGDFGDCSQSESSDTFVRLDVPDRLAVIAGGEVTTPAPPAGGRCRVDITSPLCRNLAVVLGVGFGSVRTDVAGVTVDSWCRTADMAAGGTAMSAAAEALALFDERFGAYPYRSLRIVEAPLAADLLGMESTGLILINASLYAAGPETSLPFHRTVAHEVAHQWWYGVVGSDACREPWLDEALASWSDWYFLQVRYPPAVADEAASELALTVDRHPDAYLRAMDLATRDYDLQEWYTAVVFARGTLMYQALRKTMGDAAFFAFLRQWYADRRFRLSTAEDWQACLRAHLPADRAIAFVKLWIKAEGLGLGQINAAAELP